MNTESNHTDDLKEIRKIMEKSSRFLSLSGLSGVIIGILAMAGAVLGMIYINDNDPSAGLRTDPAVFITRQGLILLVDALLVLTAAVITAYIFALKKCRKQETLFWSQVTRRLIINLSIPLIFGALFIAVLIINGDPEYIISAMLSFYGMALINAGKFTFDEVRYLGILELILGIAAGLFPEYGLIMWILGFGFLHILYGIILHRKYN